MNQNVVYNQNHNNGKRPQINKKIVPTSIAHKSTPNVLSLTKIMKNPIHQLAT